jgi:plastocyanin
VTPSGPRRARAGIGLLAAALAAGCSGSRPQVHQVTIQGFAYQPVSVSAAPGDTIVWTNRDVAAHTATSPGKWDSGPIAPGASWRMVVAEGSAGAYSCAYHPTMKGTVASSK